MNQTRKGLYVLLALIFVFAGTAFLTEGMIGGSAFWLFYRVTDGSSFEFPNGAMVEVEGRWWLRKIDDRGLSASRIPVREMSETWTTVVSSMNYEELCSYITQIGSGDVDLNLKDGRYVQYSRPDTQEGATEVIAYNESAGVLVEGVEIPERDVDSWYEATTSAVVYKGMDVQFDGESIIRCRGSLSKQ